MTDSMISGVSAFAHPVGARFCQPEERSCAMFGQNTRGTKREVYRDNLPTCKASIVPSRNDLWCIISAARFGPKVRS